MVGGLFDTRDGKGFRDDRARPALVFNNIMKIRVKS
jgi:hypothetical protein